LYTIRANNGRGISTPLAGLVFVLLIGFGEFITRNEGHHEHLERQSHSATIAANVRGALQNHIDSVAQVTTGLAAFLADQQGLTEEGEQALLQTSVDNNPLLAGGCVVKPNGRITRCIERDRSELFGDEIIGRADVSRVLARMESDAEPTLMGPLEYAPGNEGLVVLTPVPVTRQSQPAVILTVIDMSRLVAAARTDNRTRVETAWALRVKANDTRGSSETFWGPEALNRADATTNPLQIHDLNWELVLTSENTQPGGSRRVAILRFLSILCALTVSGLFYFTLSEREQIHRMALTDPLTGLPNRRLLEERISQRIHLARRYRTNFCLLHVDLNNFKHINDQHGHRAGDHVLRTVAQRFAEALRSSDTIARIGGDEFIILLPDAEDAHAAQSVADNLGQVIRRPMAYESLRLNTSGSFGIACYPDHGETSDALIDHADKNMYAHKRRERTSA
jgi:diguanylate cyclase (GGDEF)-like protein